MRIYVLIIVIALGADLPIAMADEKVDPLGYRPVPLYATELYTRMLPSLSDHLTEAGRSTETAEYLVWAITERIAHCSTEQLTQVKAPQVRSFLVLLTTESMYKNVTDQLHIQYTDGEFEELMGLVDDVTKSCKEKAFADFNVSIK